MARSTRKPPSNPSRCRALVRRPGWMAAIWLGSVAALGVVAWLLHMWLHPQFGLLAQAGTGLALDG